MAQCDALLREALLLAGLLAIPVLFAGALTGTIVGVLQAATQVQEQTLSMLPKLLAVGIVVSLFGAFGLRLCASLFVEAIAALPALVRT